ncbi:MAG: outer membrane protein assembly factor BamC, partial [Acidovorax sp.]|nr:outer membrane protein assembly factor BamC [Acidovorax sp.]
LYSTSERDRFRTRLERRPDGKTEIYVTHRGMQEVYTNQQKDSTVWQPRAVDPELETEFLRRIMVRLGSTDEQSKAVVAAGGNKPTVAQTARVSTLNGQPAVEIDEGFDRAWRRVGVALDRTGFTVEDRDRSKGLYFVRYVPANPDTEAKKKGFFGSLFGSKAEAKPAKYQIAVRSEGAKSHVVVLGENGQPESDVNAQRIVRVIADDLK